MRVWLGFALFCFAAGSRWLLEEAVPAPLPVLVRESVHYGMLTVLLAVVAGVRRENWSTNWVVVAGLGGLVFGVPRVLNALAGGSVTGFTATLVYTLVPVVVVFVVAQQASGFGVDDGARGLVGPALAGVAGAALMIPFAMPPSVPGKFWLAGMVAAAVAAGVGVVQLQKALRGSGVWGAAALVSGVVAMLSGLAGCTDWGAVKGLDGRTWGLETAIALGVDGPLLALGVWLVREMAPVRFAARYLLVLLVTIVEGFVLVRPGLSWYTGVGMALMAGAVWMLLRADFEGSRVA